MKRLMRLLVTFLISGILVTMPLVSFAAPPPVPAAPTSSNITQTTVTLSWKAVTGATSYYLYQDGALIYNGSSLSYNVEGLVPSKTYVFTVKSYNGGGTSGLSAASTDCKVTMRPPPSAPATPSVTAKTQTSLTISWNAVSGATWYYLYMNGNAEAIYSGASTSFTVDNLSPSTTYSFRVKSYNGGGSPGLSDPSGECKATTLPPPLPPTGLTVTAKTQTTLTISWNAVSGATWYYLYINGNTEAIYSGASTSFKVEKLNHSTTYSFIVKSYNGGGTRGLSDPSGECKATTLPPPPAPAKPIVTDKTQTSISISWNAVAGATWYYLYMNDNSEAIYSGASTSFTVDNLNPSTTYSFRVKSYNGGEGTPGLSVPSEECKVTTLSQAGTDTTFTVSYDANGGTGAPGKQEKTDGQTLMLSSQTPVREGYIFLGWSTSKSASSATFFAGRAYTPNANVTLFAVWAPSSMKYTAISLPYDKKEALKTTDSLSINNSYGKGYSFIAKAGQTVEITMSSSQFDSYLYLADAMALNGIIDRSFSVNALAGKVGSGTAEIKHNFLNDGTYYIQATQPKNGKAVGDYRISVKIVPTQTYSVSYYANGGLNPPSPQTKILGSYIIISSQSPTRLGYKFEGWSTSEGATSPNHAYDPGKLYTADANISLYAVWSQSSTLSAPTGLSVTKSGNSFTISWDPVSGAEKYRLYKGTLAINCDTLIYEGTRNSFTVVDTLGPKYCVMVTAFNGSRGESLGSFPIEILTTPQPPKIYSSEASKVNVGYTRMRFRLEPDSYLYISDKIDGEYEMVMDSQFNEFAQVLTIHGESLKPGTTYYFKQAHHPFSLSSPLVISTAVAIATLTPDKNSPKGLNEEEKETFQLMNLERTVRGLKPLQIDDKLIKIAREKCADMAERNYFDHNEPGGYFNWRFSDIGYNGSCGENIYYGTSTFNNARVNQKFMESEGHRKNILDPKYTHVGVGTIISESTQSKVKNIYRFAAQEFYKANGTATMSRAYDITTPIVTHSGEENPTESEFVLSAEEDTAFETEVGQNLEFSVAGITLNLDCLEGNFSAEDSKYGMLLNGDAEVLVTSGDFLRCIEVTPQTEILVAVNDEGQIEILKIDAAIGSFISYEACETPEADPPSGMVPETTTVTLSSSIEDAAIYYTTDGSEPTLESEEFSAPISILGTEVTVKAMTVKDGMEPSPIAAFVYNTGSGDTNVVQKVPGDVNEDGSIDAKDVGILNRYLAGWSVSINRANADVNQDGFVDAKDVGILNRYLAEWAGIVLQ